MKKNTPNKIQKIKWWISDNGITIAGILSIVICISLYFLLTRSYRITKFQEYSEIVHLIDLKHEKIYALPGLYSTEQKIDRILFDLDYEYQGVNYQAKTVIYSEYLSPSLERILETGDWDRLQVKCKKGAPEQVMVFNDQE